jgi:hypothetical protein
MALGRDEHLLEASAVALLDATSPRKLGLGLAKADRKPIANALELGHPEDSGPACGGDPELDSLAWERHSEQLAKPALQHGDLAAQLVANLALDDPVVKPFRYRDLEQLVGHAGSLQPGSLNGNLNRDRGAPRGLSSDDPYDRMTLAASQMASSTEMSGTPLT